MVATPGSRTYAFDANLLLSDNAAAYTASGYSQVGGADGILDLGGNQSASPKQQARMDAMLVIDVSAIDIASGDELYRLCTVLSNDPAFLTGNVQGPELVLGKGTQLDILNGADSVIGRYEVPVSTEVAGTLYQYAKVYNKISGTTPSISYLAFLAELPCE